MRSAEKKLPLPKGPFEIPIVIQDRTFNPDASLFYPAEWVSEFFRQHHSGQRQGLALPERRASAVPVPDPEWVQRPVLYPEV